MRRPVDEKGPRIPSRARQALAKTERGHETDLRHVREMFARGLIEAPELRRLFLVIEPSLYRYPAIDPRSFRRAFGEVLAAIGKQAGP